jgi:hypothetical protein
MLAKPLELIGAEALRERTRLVCIRVRQEREEALTIPHTGRSVEVAEAAKIDPGSDGLTGTAPEHDEHARCRELERSREVARRARVQCFGHAALLTRLATNDLR